MLVGRLVAKADVVIAGYAHAQKNSRLLPPHISKRKQKGGAVV